MAALTVDVNTLHRISELPWSYISLLLLGGFIAYTLYSYMQLRHIPGPFLAALSNIPRLYWVLTGRAQEYHIGLHKRYGHLVRMGPNMVSVGDPGEIAKIYGITGKFKKVCRTSGDTKGMEKLMRGTVRVLPSHQAIGERESDAGTLQRAR